MGCPSRLFSFSETSESDRAVELGLELSVLSPAAGQRPHTPRSERSSKRGAGLAERVWGGQCSPELSALRRIFNNESKLISSHISLLLFDSIR
jgi:hypothetical protein